MVIIKNSIYICLFLFFYAQTVDAQNFLSLADALSLTLMNNPEINAYSYDERAGDAKALQASLRPNPALDIETENLGTPIFMQTTFLLSQLIELGGKRHARMELAETEKDKATLDYEVLKRQIFVDTTLLFIDVLISQQKISFLEENLNFLQEFASVVEKRLKAGKASIIEESNFIVMLNTARIELKNAQTELKTAKRKLAAQWGETCNDAFVIVGDLDWIPTVIPLSEIGGFIEEHPQIVRSYFEDNLRAARIRLEKSKAYPDINVRGGPRYLEEAHKWVWVVGVSIPLTINDRNQGRIGESRAYLDRLEKEREVIWNKLLTELNTSYLTIQTVLFELNLLKNNILPAAQKAYEFSSDGHAQAKYSYLERLETERTYRTSKIRYLQALGEYHKALAILQGLTGSKAIINQQYE